MSATSTLDMDGDTLVHALAMVLDGVMVSNEKNTAKRATPLVTRFCSSYAPNLKVIDYLTRIRKYSNCSDSCFIVCLIYVDRIINSNRFILTRLNVHRVVLTAILLATKSLDDTFYNNKFYADLGGVSLPEINSLELEFLSLTRFELHVNDQQFSTYRENLRTFLGRQSKSNLEIFKPTPPVVKAVATQAPVLHTAAPCLLQLRLLHLFPGYLHQLQLLCQCQ